MLLFQLPDDVLYHILAYLDHRSLSRFSQVCKSAYSFVNRDNVWKNVAKQFLNTGIRRNGSDLYPKIPLKERVRTAQNWSSGLCTKDVLIRWRKNLLPWLQIDGNILFLSQAAEIRAHRVHQNAKKILSQPFQIYSGHNGDVCRFVLNNSYLISSGSDGTIVVHSRRSGAQTKLPGHSQEINCLDSRDELIISGSRDTTVKVWTLTSSSSKETISTFDRVWSIAIDPSVSSFAVGTACCRTPSPLHIWTIERLECVCSLGSDFRRGAGVLDIVFETPFQLLTCGYDTYIRLWDLRLSTRPPPSEPLESSQNYGHHTESPCNPAPHFSLPNVN
ncbi:F-box/WD repeat-containing protein 4 isoform X2 [Boleophthalmus pectinirostris]|uniref:F-box/WD repeat-containing protein 4 isoform X2 n=1 Tax=Boleophthalmus pectinirostris TaxID=150288 RepID=UPI002431A19D|nr:F-box/WD repeat-containing protein 4 isoform X2 [Boleophthalmus pectinirostris]